MFKGKVFRPGPSDLVWYKWGGMLGLLCLRFKGMVLKYGETVKEHKHKEFQIRVKLGLFICEPKFLARPEFLSPGQNFGLKFRPGDRHCGLAGNFGSQMNSPYESNFRKSFLSLNV